MIQDSELLFFWEGPGFSFSFFGNIPVCDCVVCQNLSILCQIYWSYVETLHGCRMWRATCSHVIEGRSPVKLVENIFYVRISEVRQTSASWRLKHVPDRVFCRQLKLCIKYWEIRRTFGVIMYFHTQRLLVSERHLCLSWC